MTMPTTIPELPGQGLITSQTLDLLEKCLRENLPLVVTSTGGKEGFYYGDRHYHIGEVLRLDPSAKWNARLLQSGMLRLKGPEAPPVDPVAQARQQYHETTVTPLALEKLQLEQTIDDCNATIEAAQDRQDEARAKLKDVRARFNAALAAAPN